ncbi:MAG: hypothetical protein H7196_01715 [candidate division SR1 bacterium]|nr:hypothetical protein [candidate division SR1 bacterium]
MFKQLYLVIIIGVTVLITGSLGFVIYQRVQNSEVSCEKIVSKFKSLASNPTNVITGNEKIILKSITQTGLIEDIKSEQLILKIRKLSPNYTLQSNPVNYLNQDKNYASSKLHFETKSPNFKSFDVILQMENIQNFWLSDKCVIFKVETPANFETVDEPLKAIKDNGLIDKANQIKDEGVKAITNTLNGITGGQK